jgi:hypothetical protein
MTWINRDKSEIIKGLTGFGTLQRFFSQLNVPMGNSLALIRCSIAQKRESVVFCQSSTALTEASLTG